MLDGLAAAADQGSLVAFVGAGVSRTWTDPSTNRVSQGIPGGQEVVQLLRETRPWIEESWSFDEAMFALRVQEGRAALEQFLLNLMDRPTINPLPAHNLLASLGIRSFVTSNYDRLLERAVEDTGARTVAVIADVDVARVTPRDVPVIKYHGCLTRPQTIIAAKDEYIPIAESKPVVSALLSTLLANKTLLFVGFALNDPDFISAYDSLQRSLGDYMPRSFIIARSVTPFQNLYWKERKLTIIEGDLTEQLRQLVHLRSQRDLTPMQSLTDWSSNAFFESLHSIRNKPSETQVTDAYLEHLNELVAKGVLDIHDVVQSAEAARKLLLETRPNFLAFQSISGKALSLLEAANAAGNGLADELRDFMLARTQISNDIARHGSLLPSGSILATYSQSRRVQQVLQAVPVSIQQTSKLFIGECRPKSPVEFQDALEVSKALSDTKYQMTLVPDVALLHLLTRHQISHLLLGAHAVYVEAGQPTWFVNTAGSAALCRTAVENNVKVFVIAENVKLEHLDAGHAPAVSYAEEEQLFRGLESEFGMLRARGVSISAVNIGYDLIPLGQGMTILTEDQVWTL